MRRLRRNLHDTAESKRLRCSFCGRDADQVRFLSAGVAGGTICDVCCLKALLIFVKAHVTAFFRVTTVAA
jgi:ClpX C4-type zinc finger